MRLDDAVLDIQRAVKNVESPVIVSDDNDARMVFMGDAGEEFHDLTATFLVECGGGFICEDQTGVVRKRAGDGDALLFAAGECGRKIVGTWADAELVEQFLSASGCLARWDIVDLHRDPHVFEGCQKWDEIRFLKYETQVFAAERAEIHKCVWTVEHWRSADGNFAGSGRVDQGHGREQS